MEKLNFTGIAGEKRAEFHDSAQICEKTAEQAIALYASEFLTQGQGTSCLSYSAEAVTDQTVRYVAMLYSKNIAALHGAEIPYSEWCGLISAGDTDERHFLIRKGAVPCAYLKINGLESGDDIGWISMLAAEPAFQRKGIGTYAVCFAEKYLQNMGKSVVKIHTTCDNIPAQRLYEKCGYSLLDDGGDKLTYTKLLP